MCCCVLLASCSGGGGGSAGTTALPPASPGTTAPTTAPNSTPTPVAHASATPTTGPAASGPYVDWSTYGFDGARSGNNPSEGTLGAGNVAGLHLIWSASFGGDMTGQPVLAAGVNISGTTHNVLYVGTHAGQFLALDADSGTTLWQQQLKSATYTCGSNESTGVDRAAEHSPHADRPMLADELVERPRAHSGRQGHVAAGVGRLGQA